MEHMEEKPDLAPADLMQKELLERACSRAHAFTHEDRLAATLEWVDKNASRFRELMKERPDLEERFAQDPEAALSAVEEGLDRD